MKKFTFALAIDEPTRLHHMLSRLKPDINRLTCTAAILLPQAIVLIVDDHGDCTDAQQIDSKYAWADMHINYLCFH